jgi:hypothetical protein
VPVTDDDVAADDAAAALLIAAPFSTGVLIVYAHDTDAAGL